MNLEAIRKDFPVLGKKINGKLPVYFDNACMSLRPKQVVEAMQKYYEEYPACGGRSGHKFAKIVTDKTAEARETIAKFINARKKEEIVFTRNATEGINLVAHSLGLKEGDIVLTTDREHNSNLVPWQILVGKTGIIHHIAHSNIDNTFDLENFKYELAKGAKLVAMVHTSNLDGVTIPVKEIIKLAHKAGAKVLLDCAQSAAHFEINVKDLGVDFLVLSGHKILGPSGIGILYAKYEHLENMEPFMVGGSTVQFTTYTDFKLLPPPEKFEAGLQDYAGIIGFAEAVRYLSDIGFKDIQKHDLEMNRFITDSIKSIPKLHIIGPEDPAQRGGIVSFYVDGLDAHKIAMMLDASDNIMVRSGQHCVHSWFNAHGITASVRASFYLYNTMEEAEIFVVALKKTISIL
jgi:cysteine desulfurase/selenocysteine lyase